MGVVAFTHVHNNRRWIPRLFLQPRHQSACDRHSATEGLRSLYWRFNAHLGCKWHLRSLRTVLSRYWWFLHSLLRIGSLYFGPTPTVGSALCPPVERKRKQQADSIWFIKPSDLLYEKSPEILGRGTFGLVVRAECRGTQVAVKRVIPPLSQSRDGAGSNEKHLSSMISLPTSASSGSILPLAAPRKSLQMRSSRCFEFSMSIRLDHHGSTSSSEVLDGNRGDGMHALSCGQSSHQGPGHVSCITKRQPVRETQGRFYSRDAIVVKVKASLYTDCHGCGPFVRRRAASRNGANGHGSLFDLLHNDSMVVEGDIVLQILRDVAPGHRFLHAAIPQVVHGDLKAQNILVDSKFRAKVADFGLSQKKDVGAAGTPFWMAPELLKGTSTNTAAFEVYSFGIILYEVYSRKLLYENEDFEATIEQIRDPYINKRPPVPELMPPEIVTLMNACTNAAHPDIRPTFRVIDDKLKVFDVNSVEPGQLYFSLQKKKEWDTT